MENSNTILNELKVISTVVAAISKQQVYTVPERYFESLPVQVMLRIAMEEKAGNEPRLNINKDNVYQVPQGYFDSLAATILNRIKVEAADKQLDEPDFSSPVWQQVGKKNPFTIPEGYFNEVSDNILAGAKAIEFVNGELENLSPLMASLKTKQVYEVPDGYFDGTTAAIFEKIKNQQPAKVILFGFGKKVMRYAAAAVVTGIIVIAGYMYSGKVAVATPDNPVAELSKATDLDLENFLNNSTASVADTSMLVPAASDDISDKDSKDLLANISDEELQQYAEQHLETPITN